MKQRIIELRRNERGQFLAQLECGQLTCVKHRPPYSPARVGRLVGCERCAESAESNAERVMA